MVCSYINRDLRYLTQIFTFTLATDIVIGFEKTSYVINEGIDTGKLEVCVKIFNPMDGQTLPATILLTIQSRPNTGYSLVLYLKVSCILHLFIRFVF